jgi:hypothetical protein
MGQPVNPIWAVLADEAEENLQACLLTEDLF